MNFKLRRARVRAQTVLARMGIGSSGKIFCLGLGRTGSVSINLLFREAGRLSHHGTTWRAPDQAALRCRYECFCDAPFHPDPGDFEFLDRHYPRARFILNVRDLEPWLISRISLKRHQKRLGRDYTPGGWHETPEVIDAMIRNRNDYHISVLRYFANRETDFLILNFVSDPDSVDKLARFAGLPGARTEKPHTNRTSPDSPERRDRTEIAEYVTQSMDRLGIPAAERRYDLFCPSLADPALIEGLAPDSRA